MANVEVRVFESAVIDAPVGRVWALIGDFDSMPDWQPAIMHSEIENGLPGTAIGCIRRTTQRDGTQIRAVQVARSDAETFYAYEILSAPIPIANYAGTLRLRPVTANERTYIEWSCRFDAEPAVVQNAAAVLREAFRTSFEHIGRLCAG